jgi:hypothetical protein
MPFHPRSRLLLAALLVSVTATSCAVVGPNAIRSGRMAYNEAITATNNAPMLTVPVSG